MKLDKRQKILITLIVIAFAYVAWQLYDMFGSGDEVAPAPGPVVRPVQAVRPAATAPSVASITPTAQVTARPTLTTITTPQPTSSVTGPVEQPLMVAPTTAYQRQYVQLLNQYHLTKLQRQVIDEQVAIAAAQAKMAQINADTQKLGGAATPTFTSNVVSTATSSGYKLVYLDNQAGKWTATLSQNGNLIEVNTGDVLADGTEILDISQRGVLINRRGTRYLISFNGISVARAAEIKNSNAGSGARLNNDLFPLKPVVKTTVKETTTPKTTTTQTTVTTTAPAKSLFTLTPPATTTTTTTTAIPSIANKTTATTVTTTSNPANGNTATTITVPSSKPAQADRSTTNVTTVSKTTPPVTVTAEKTTTVTATTAVPATAAPATKSTTTVTTVTTPTPAAPTPTAMTTLNNQQVTSNFNLTPQQQTKVAELTTTLNNTNTTKQTYTDAEKALLAIPSDYYTVQLMGSRKESDLTNMIKQYNLKNTYIFQTTYLEHPWFVLVYGSFKTEQAANSAIKQLPLAVQQIKPWVRPMLSVHNAIKR